MDKKAHRLNSIKVKRSSEASLFFLLQSHTVIKSHVKDLGLYIFVRGSGGLINGEAYIPVGL